MLYTVRPMERIYAPPEVFTQNTKNNTENMVATDQEYKEIILPNGRLVTRKNGEKYIIERINSTDMKDYLNKKYAPGNDYSK